MPPSTSPPTVRVIVRLPYNRPQEGYENPPRIEWNAEKEDILWAVIARSRASDSVGPDWQGLAAHLAVPLPYLLFRAQSRYEEDLRGLQLHTGALGPTVTQPQTRPLDDDGKALDHPELVRRTSGRVTTGSTKLSSSARMNTPLAVRARLNSLGYDSGHRQSKASSSSVTTLQGARNNPPFARPASSTSSRSESESEDEAEKAEEEERRLEEQEALDKKLKHLQTIMTSDAIGLVHDVRPKLKGKEPQRGRDLMSPASPSPLRQTFQRRDPSSSDFNSATSSLQDSEIPSIPSPPPEPQSQLPRTRHLTQGKKSSSPPALSSSQARGQAHTYYRPMAVGMTQASDRSSTQGSSASSFSDISESISLSTSALESALSSNIRGTGSRLARTYSSAFARSQFGRRASGHQ